MSPELSAANVDDRQITASPENIVDSDEDDGSVVGDGDAAGNDAVQMDVGSEDEDDETEEDESEDEDDDENDDEDDDEPALKYERLGGIVSKLLTKDSASTLAHANQRLVSLDQPVVILGL